MRKLNDTRDREVGEGSKNAFCPYTVDSLVTPPIGPIRILDWNFYLAVTQQSRPNHDGGIKSGLVSLTLYPAGAREAHRLARDGFDDHIILDVDIDAASKLWTLGVTELAPAINQKLHEPQNNTAIEVMEGPLSP